MNTPQEPVGEPVWMACRRLVDPQGGQVVWVRVGVPQVVSRLEGGDAATEAMGPLAIYLADPQDTDWRCPYQVAVAAQVPSAEQGPVFTEPPEWAFGVDSMQALQLALEHIHRVLRGRGLSWLGGEPGLTGFTRSVPISFGTPLVQHLDALIETETDRFAGELMRVEGGVPTPP